VERHGFRPKSQADTAGVGGLLGTRIKGVPTITGDVGKAAAITRDVGNGAAAVIGDDAGRAAAAARDGSEAGAAGEAEKPVQIMLRGVDHSIADWHLEAITYTSTRRTDAAREALRTEFPPARRPS
jgi:hypothetical protein